MLQNSLDNYDFDDFPKELYLPEQTHLAPTFPQFEHLYFFEEQRKHFTCSSE